MSISCLPSAFDFQSASASVKLVPVAWMQKSTWQVVPPNGMSRCVCGSTAPGRTYLPDASITMSAGTSIDSPIREIRSFSTKMSAT